MTTPEYLEAMMLISFTLGWYWSILSMVRTRQPRGKSSPFVLLTVLGYCLGIAAKLHIWSQGSPLSYVTLIYAWNLALTTIDLALVWHLERALRQRASQSPSTLAPSLSPK